MMPRPRIAGVLALAWLAACAGNTDTVPLVASDVRVTAARPGTSMSAGYLTLENPGASPVAVTHVTSPEYERVELHETVVENDVARMRPLAGLSILPGETLRLEPGGRHLMLMQRRADGASTTLEFWSGDTLLLRVDALAAAGD
jgi:copper(I)-binding protein